MSPLIAPNLGRVISPREVAPSDPTPPGPSQFWGFNGAPPNYTAYELDGSLDISVTRLSGKDLRTYSGGWPTISAVRSQQIISPTAGGLVGPGSLVYRSSVQQPPDCPHHIAVWDVVGDAGYVSVRDNSTAEPTKGGFWDFYIHGPYWRPFNQKLYWIEAKLFSGTPPSGIVRLYQSNADLTSITQLGFGLIPQSIFTESEDDALFDVINSSHDLAWEYWSVDYLDVYFDVKGYLGTTLKKTYREWMRWSLPGGTFLERGSYTSASHYANKQARGFFGVPYLFGNNNSKSFVNSGSASDGRGDLLVFKTKTPFDTTTPVIIQDLWPDGFETLGADPLNSDLYCFGSEAALYRDSGGIVAAHSIATLGPSPPPDLEADNATSYTEAALAKALP